MLKGKGGMNTLPQIDEQIEWELRGGGREKRGEDPRGGDGTETKR